MVTKKEKPKDESDEIVLIGDYNWRTVRNTLVQDLMQCNSESDFTRVMMAILASVGTEEQIQKVRKKLGIHDFTEEDKKIIRGEE